jgi:hypothetical protein
MEAYFVIIFPAENRRYLPVSASQRLVIWSLCRTEAETITAWGKPPEK